MKNKIKTVVFFGDSHLGRFNRDRIDKLEKSVSNILVYSCAVGGWDTRDALKRADLVSELNPGYTVLSFPANDTTPSKNISLEETKGNLDKIIRLFKNSKIILFVTPYADERFEDAGFNKRALEYNKAAREVAEANKVQIIDGPEVYKNLENYHEDDGIHLNEYGYEILIAEIAKNLK